MTQKNVSRKDSASPLELKTALQRSHQKKKVVHCNISESHIIGTVIIYSHGRIRRLVIKESLEKN